MLSPFKNRCFWFYYVLKIQKRKQRNKKSLFLVNSRCFCFAFHANITSDEKKDLIFVNNSINIVDKHVNQFVSVNSIADKDSEIFCYKDNKVMQYNSVEQNNRILSLHRKRKIKHLSFFLRFSIIGINLLIRGSIEVNIR